MVPRCVARNSHYSWEFRAVPQGPSPGTPIRIGTKNPGPSERVGTVQGPSVRLLKENPASGRFSGNSPQMRHMAPKIVLFWTHLLEYFQGWCVFFAT